MTELRMIDYFSPSYVVGVYDRSEGTYIITYIQYNITLYNIYYLAADPAPDQHFDHVNIDVCCGNG